MARPLVLVVEDDGATRGLLTLLPRSHGYEVRLTSTGREALQELGNRTPDVMILDLGLPDMDGYHVRQSGSELRESLSKKQRTVTASGVGYRLIDPVTDSR